MLTVSSNTYYKRALVVKIKKCIGSKITYNFHGAQQQHMPCQDFTQYLPNIRLQCDVSALPETSEHNHKSSQMILCDKTLTILKPVLLNLIKIASNLACCFNSGKVPVFQDNFIAQD